MNRPQAMMIRGWIRATLVGACLLATVGCEAEPTDPSSQASAETSPVLERIGPRVGTTAPNFQLWDLDGKRISLSQYQGRVVLLNFWATWCGPCRVEMPTMEQLYRTFSRKDFEILAVSIDVQGVAITRPFQQEYHLTFPILHDADYRVGLTYGARSIPMTFLVDRQGVVRHRIFGARDWGASDARQLVQMLINS